MNLKEFGLLVKIYRKENLNKNDLDLLGFIIKDIKSSINDVTVKAINNFLPDLKSKFNYELKDEKVILDYIKQTIIKTVLEETGIVHKYFFGGRDSFIEKTTAQVQGILNSSAFSSPIFIQSLKGGAKLINQTVSLKKTNSNLLTYKSFADKFSHKDLSPERLTFYTEIINEQKLLEHAHGRCHRSSFKKAVWNVLRRSNRNVKEELVTREYKAFWSWKSHN